MGKSSEPEPSPLSLAEQLELLVVYELRRRNHHQDNPLHGADHALLGLLELSWQGEKAVTPSMLSDHLQFSRSMVTSMLNILDKGGYISRSINPQDRRQVVISLTEKGKNHMEYKRRSMAHVFSYVCDFLGEEDTRELVRLMGRVREAMDQYALKGEKTEK